jgi:hypothetical protein
MNNEDLLPVFMPSLAALLLHHERKKGAPLTEAEVIAIRNEATVVMVPRGHVSAVEEKRGYKDIDPELCWLQWRLLRTSFADVSKLDGISDAEGQQSAG